MMRHLTKEKTLSVRGSERDEGKCCVKSLIVMLLRCKFGVLAMHQVS